MQDRVPTYPGRVKLIPVQGQENTYDMERADQPTQVGTPLNKATLLKDATAALFGLGTDAVPDDVLKQIPKTVGFQEGDIRTTVKTDLGEKWLLCNGALVSRSEYPDLSELIPNQFNGALRPIRNITSSSGTDTNTGSPGMVYANGFYVVAYTYQKETDLSDVRVAYTTDVVNGAWTKDIVIWNGELFDSSFGECHNVAANIKYVNGYFIITGRHGVAVNDSTGNPKYAPAIAFATNPAGPWTTVDLGDTSVYDSVSTYVYDIIYEDGLYVAMGKMNSASYVDSGIWYATTLNGNWKFIEVDTDNDRTAQAVRSGLYDGSRFLFVGRDSSSSGAGVLYTATNLSVSNEVREVMSAGRNFIKIVYSGEYYVILDDSGTNDPWLRYADSYTGPWYTITLNDIKPIDLYYINGLYIVLGYYSDSAICVYSNSINGPWTRFEIWGGLSDEYGPNLTYDGNKYIFAGTRKSTNSFISTRAQDTTKMVLPEISVDAAYAYIKAKEGLEYEHTNFQTTFTP